MWSQVADAPCPRKDQDRHKRFNEVGKAELWSQVTDVPCPRKDLDRHKRFNEAGNAESQLHTALDRKIHVMMGVQLQDRRLKSVKRAMCRYVNEIISGLCRDSTSRDPKRPSEITILLQNGLIGNFTAFPVPKNSHDVTASMGDYHPLNLARPLQPFGSAGRTASFFRRSTPLVLPHHDLRESNVLQHQRYCCP